MELTWQSWREAIEIKILNEEGISLRGEDSTYLPHFETREVEASKSLSLYRTRRHTFLRTRETLTNQA